MNMDESLDRDFQAQVAADKVRERPFSQLFNLNLGASQATGSRATEGNVSYYH